MQQNYTSVSQYRDFIHVAGKTAILCSNNYTSNSYTCTCVGQCQLDRMTTVQDLPNGGIAKQLTRVHCNIGENTHEKQQQPVLQFYI